MEKKESPPSDTVQLLFEYSIEPQLDKIYTDLSDHRESSESQLR